MISWANSCGREEVYYFSLSLVVYVLLLKVGLGRSAVTMFLGTIENHIVSENGVVELVACHSWDDSICIYVSCGHQSTFDFFISGPVANRSKLWRISLEFTHWKYISVLLFVFLFSFLLNIFFFIVKCDRKCDNECQIRLHTFPIFNLICTKSAFNFKMRKFQMKCVHVCVCVASFNVYFKF